MERLKGERGFSLIEVTLGMLVMLVLTVAFFRALDTAILARHQANVRTTATSLADGQIERIKAGPYSVAHDGIGSYLFELSSIPSGFQLATLADPYDEDSAAVVTYTDPDTGIEYGVIYGIPWDIDNDAPWTQATPIEDPGIQRIAVVVESNNFPKSGGTFREVFRLADFVVNR